MRYTVERFGVHLDEDEADDSCDGDEDESNVTIRLVILRSNIVCDTLDSV